LIGSATELYETSLYLEDYEAFVGMREALASKQSGLPAPVGFECLRVEHVSFSYPESERLALDDVSLEMHRGEIIALVGENGSGKTTLAKLLCGLYRPVSGRVLWDGEDVAAFDAASLRRSIAVLFQDFCHYFLTLRENIGVGRHELAADLLAVRGAAQQAGADSFVAGMRDGYETLLGEEFEGGHNLSIGQWQRVALARAFLRDASFVILDEPTASLDARAEHDLFESIRELFRGRTVLLISHRFSSVRSADRIYVLRQGRLEESGTHAELMRANGVYAELFNLQAQAYTSVTLQA
jgi:ATP-binding cassette subfamily B protein